MEMKTVHKYNRSCDKTMIEEAVSDKTIA